MAARWLGSAAIVALAGVAAGTAASAEPLGLGRPATAEEVEAWNIDVRPDGQGLPEGQGDVSTGEEIYTERCASCHGVFGEGEGRWPQLMGGFGTLDGNRPVKTIGSYWPFASTVWDYVHRAMPFGDARSLSADETYALAAYLLYLNEVVDEDFVATPESYAAVEMPNAGGFYPDDRDEVELPKFSGEPCMTDCKEEVEITMHAAVLDVTPEAAGGDLEGGAADQPSQAADEPAADAPQPAADAAPPEGAAAIGEASADAALIDQGESLFRQCRACHEIGPDAENRIGPRLTGVVGRAAGSVEGFSYSPALRQAGEDGLVWDAHSLASFLSDPAGYMPGTKMTFRGLAREDAEAMAAYLGSLDSEG